MNDIDESDPGARLLEKVAFLHFEVVDERLERTIDGDVIVSVRLLLGERDEDGERSEDHEWGALAFIFCIAVLSFHDAEPAYIAHPQYRSTDEFTLSDLFDHLRYRGTHLRLHCEQLHGRRMETEIIVEADGTVTIQVRNRKQTPVHWVALLKGRKSSHD